MNREKIKMLILLSSTVEEADTIIIETQHLYSTREKIAYLKGMFDVNLVGRANSDGLTEDDSIEMDYYALLSTIINSKWED